MTAYDHFVVFVFAIAFPVYAFVSYRKNKQALTDNVPGVRTRDYQQTSAWLWALCLLSLFVWFQNDRSLAGLGLGWPASLSAWVLLFLVVVAAVLLFFQYRQIQRDAEQRKSVAEKMAQVSAVEFLPRTTPETRWFVLLSISAGICEEVLFRGYLIWYFEEFTNQVAAVILSSLLFGIAHSYQGWKGGVRAGIAGLVMALSYVLTGSLWVPVFIHIVGDIHAGILAWLAFAETDTESVT